MPDHFSHEDIVLSEENEFPTQVGDASGTPHLSVGCVRNDYGMPEQVQFWSVADNVRFGGALMAVKIAEKLVQEYLAKKAILEEDNRWQEKNMAVWAKKDTVEYFTKNSCRS